MSPCAPDTSGPGLLVGAGGPDPRDEACRVLLRLESPETRSRELVDETLGALGFAEADGVLFSELVFGTLQKRALLDYRLASVSHRPLEALSPWVRNLLRLS
ncbi:MAG: transcription antitermination factor NusB, partial [bacterium]